MNKRSHELLKNFELVYFIDYEKIYLYIDFFSKTIFLSEKEQQFMIYYKNTWLKKIKNYLTILIY